MATREARILILCKTYPSPSERYSETSCVAGVDEHGKLIRLFPVPFRLINDEKQFRKWQWIKARVAKASNDHRKESHRLLIDTIVCQGNPISTQHDWRQRREILKRIEIFNDFAALENARESKGSTLSILRPTEVVNLEIRSSPNSEWTEEEKKKLIAHQKQAGLFDEIEAKSISTLKKVPFDFYYNYTCEVGGTLHSYRHKIVDWEAGALFWRCRRAHGGNWEEPFRKKLEEEFKERDLMFLMGTLHRFPSQWLIVSLIYPPKQRVALPDQLTLFDV